MAAAAAVAVASRGGNAMKAWAKGDRVVQPTYGPGTLVEVNEHHTVIDFDEHGRRTFATRLVVAAGDERAGAGQGAAQTGHQGQAERTQGAKEPKA